MKNYKYPIIISFLSILLIVMLPIFILSNALLSYKIIYFSNQYHSYQDPALVEDLNIDVDIGNIKINYIPYPVDFSVQIDIEFELGGLILEGASFSDFFKIEWLDMDNILNFSMHIKDGKSLEKIIPQIRVMDIIISLKANLNCDIDALVQLGNVSLDIIYGISIGNVVTNVSKGDIQFQFLYCQIDGNLTGIAKDGNIIFKTENVQYSQNSILTFINDFGHTIIEILQDCEIGANITGIGTTISGIIDLIYEDNSAEIGAQFILYNKTGFGNEADNNAVGFGNEALPSLAGQKFYSYDYPAQNNYNFSLYKPFPSDMGDFIWDLRSFPN